MREQEGRIGNYAVKCVTYCVAVTCKFNRLRKQPDSGAAGGYKLSLAVWFMCFFLKREI